MGVLEGVGGREGVSGDKGVGSRVGGLRGVGICVDRLRPFVRCVGFRAAGLPLRSCCALRGRFPLGRICARGGAGVVPSPCRWWPWLGAVWVATALCSSVLVTPASSPRAGAARVGGPSICGGRLALLVAPGSYLCSFPGRMFFRAGGPAAKRRLPVV